MGKHSHCRNSIALPHLDNLLSQFFFGLIGDFIYLQSRSVWTPVLMHVLNNSCFACDITGPAICLVLPHH
ncbi:MAG: CPBP family intramembrane metalloprotease [Candidatus Obscuribacter sp.]|nr:CPBP family intramembrane metalloprotease [Candidatus Obscuribacter sp.]